jgi:mannose-1-phosphate guanylyltransferase
MKLIITAGGQGTKLWPLSRENAPKQFQPILKGGITPFQYTVDTLLKANAVENVFVSTKKSYVKFGLDQCPQIPVGQYIIEPDFKKGRGPGEGYVFITLLDKFPSQPFMLIQVDDIRQPETAFLETITEAQKVVQKEKLFITGGIKATYPVLGVDYLQLGERISSNNGLEFYKVTKFVNRLKDYQKTKELISNYHVVIHCNHMCWYPELIMKEYETYAPDWYNDLMKIRESFGKPDEEELTTEIYRNMREGTTEEVTKHSIENGCAILLPFKWLDLGTWDSIYEIFGEEGKNYIDGEGITLEGTGNIIKNDSKKKLVATYGVSDMAVIDTEDVLLIMPRDKAEKIKDILEALKTTDRARYL